MKIIENGKVREMIAEDIAEYKATFSIEQQIEQLKQNLADTDYKAIKEVTKIVKKIGSALQKLGVNDIISEEFINQENTRQEWRNEINRLESGGDTSGVD